MLPTAPSLVVLVGTAAMRILNHAIRHFSSYAWKVLSKPRFRVLFREVFYAQAGGNERLNFIRWMFRIRLKHFFSLVFFACHVVFTLPLTIRSLWDDLSLFLTMIICVWAHTLSSLDVLTFAQRWCASSSSSSSALLFAGKCKVRAAGLGKWISACSASLRTLLSRIRIHQKSTLSLTSNNTRSSLSGETLVRGVVPRRVSRKTIYYEAERLCAD